VKDDFAEGLAKTIIEQRDRIEALEAALLTQKENAGRMMTDIVAAANKDAAVAAARIEALENALAIAIKALKLEENPELAGRLSAALLTDPDKP
jgi:hypothetical protein